MCVSSRKCEAIETVVGGRSGNCRDSGSVIELENDTVLIYARSCRCYGSCIPGYINDISVLLYPIDDVSKDSCGDSRSRVVLDHDDAPRGGIVGFVGFVVCVCGHCVVLPTAVGDRNEVIRPICIAVCGCDSEELLYTNPSRSIPPSGSLLDLDTDRVDGRASIRSGSSYGERSTQIRSTCGRDSKHRIHSITR